MKVRVVLLAIGTCMSLGASAYTDGEAIAYFPFERDYASSVNTAFSRMMANGIIWPLSIPLDGRARAS